MGLIKKEFKDTFKGLIIWNIIFILFSGLYIPFTDKMTEKSDVISRFFNSIPRTFLKAFNISDMEMFLKPEGFFGSEGMAIVFIFAAVYSIMLVSKSFAGEFDNGTIEYLLIKPYSRIKIFFSKLLVMFFNITVIAAIFTVTIVWMFKFFVASNYNVEILYGFGFYTYVVEIFFISFTLFLSFTIKKGSLVNSIAMGILFLMYFGYTLLEDIKGLSFLSYISVFKYIPLVATVKNNTVYYQNGIFIILLSIVLLIVSALWFNKEDISLA
ncbi:hypothetical protein XO10_06680 [Marinitoga sp. 1135]|uniref:ABC transporter permease subunit n=1 Tax=unclassified Marinitoga TaxID=2640159 RepID=UPI0009508D34|nr:MULTISPECIES: ABC transporter permease subunit [unclassified Marinitoga]APT76202.1 hypothetical protein LN42_07235 [Marinitoga sp. 1137]NUU95961.1 hypothetical protein [Marinitoga sp. 1135]NUU97873.1 hypothetical protein [Marinitoga sp. 1138]